jgi:nicotinamidase-related amidase
MTKSALLLMDFQKFVAENWSPNRVDVVRRTREALVAARAKDVLVVHVQIGFREGHPEVSRSNPMFAELANNNLLLESDVESRTVSELEPVQGESMVVRRRTSPFFGTDLELLLRTNDVNEVVLCGIATSGVVLSAVRSAGDRDYGIVVLSDCCDDPDPVLHQVLMESLFPRQARVMQSTEWIRTKVGD